MKARPDFEQMDRLRCSGLDEKGNPCRETFESPHVSGAGPKMRLPELRRRRWDILEIPAARQWAVTAGEVDQDEMLVLCPEHWEAVQAAIGRKPPAGTPILERVSPEGVPSSPAIRAGRARPVVKPKPPLHLADHAPLSVVEGSDG